MPTPKTDLKSITFPDFINLFSLAGFVMTIVSIWHHSLLAACAYFTHFMILSFWAYKDRRGLKYVLTNPFMVTVVSIIVFVVACVVFYKSQTVKPNEQARSSGKGQQVNIIATKPNVLPEISQVYDIKYVHTNVRYDNAPYIVVLLNNKSSKNGTVNKQEVRRIVSEIVHNYGNRLTIDIYDDGKALELMNNSDEINKLSGKKLSKKQYEWISKHNIALYNSGLEDMGIDNDLSFFPTGNNNQSSSETYIP